MRKQGMKILKSAASQNLRSVSFFKILLLILFVSFCDVSMQKACAECPKTKDASGLAGPVVSSETDNEVPHFHGSKFPATFDRKGETVVVGWLDSKDICAYGNEYAAAFPNVKLSDVCFTKTKAFTPTGVIDMALGAVIDLFVKEIKAEADKHTQNFNYIAYSDAFWLNTTEKAEGRKESAKPTFAQRYYGFEILRYTDKYPIAKDKNKKTIEGTPAFKAVFGIAEDNEGIMWVEPLVFQVNASKAKISADDEKHSITTKIELSLDSVWKADNTFHKEKVATLNPIVIKGYDIATHNTLTRSCGNDDAQACKCNNPLVNSYPIALNPFVMPKSAGCENSKQCEKFWLNVLVTESDDSEAEKQLNNVADFISGGKDKVVSDLQNLIVPTKN